MDSMGGGPALASTPRSVAPPLKTPTSPIEAGASSTGFASPSSSNGGSGPPASRFVATNSPIQHVVPAPASIQSLELTDRTSPAPSASMSIQTPGNSNVNHRLRSSIACARCRRSKIKCTNSGAGTTCEACAHSGRECVYPSLGVSLPKRDPDADDATERTKRPRMRQQPVAERVGETTPRQGGARGSAADKDAGSPRPRAAVLDSPLLTPGVWSEVIDIFRHHYGTFLPFLHAPTVQPLLCGSDGLGPGSTETKSNKPALDQIAGWDMFLLGLLALTARYQPDLIRHHGGPDPEGQPDAPLRASEYYAAALRPLISAEAEGFADEPTLLKVQAVLMLGLWEWSSCHGNRTWTLIGLAIRMAQAMGLSCEDRPNDSLPAMPIPGQLAPSKQPEDPDTPDSFIDEEMRRRTFWSCFVMDRNISTGQQRPLMLRSEDLFVQLPCSEQAWAFGERVQTTFLSGADSPMRELVHGKRIQLQRWRELTHQTNRSAARLGLRPDAANNDLVPAERGLDESLNSRFVRMVDLWAQIARWACAGGMRTEKYRAWEPYSTFRHLRALLNDFRDQMPRSCRLTPANIQAHLSQRTSSTYALLHIIYSLGVIFLHRECLPFLPLYDPHPKGPPGHMRDEDDAAPKDFWTDSARELFAATRDIAELITACQARRMLVVVPVTGFGIYAVSCVGIYARHFPHMDPDGVMRSNSETQGTAASGSLLAQRATEALGRMRKRAPMAEPAFRTIYRLHRYYERIKNLKGFSSVLDAQGSHPGMSNGYPKTPVGEDPDAHTLDATLREYSFSEDEGMEPLVSASSINPLFERLDMDRGCAAAGGSWDGADARADRSRPMPSNAPASRPAESWTAINSIVHPMSGASGAGAQYGAPNAASARGSGMPDPSARCGAGHPSGPPSAGASYASERLGPGASGVGAGPASPAGMQRSNSAAGDSISVSSAMGKTFGGDDVRILIEGRTMEDCIASGSLDPRSWLADIWALHA